MQIPLLFGFIAACIWFEVPWLIAIAFGGWVVWRVINADDEGR